MHQVHHNHEIYEYEITHKGVVIKTPDGNRQTYKKRHVKGESRPNLFKFLFNRGQRNVKLTHVDVEKFIIKHYG